MGCPVGFWKRILQGLLFDLQEWSGTNSLSDKCPFYLAPTQVNPFLKKKRNTKILIAQFLPFGTHSQNKSKYCRKMMSGTRNCWIMARITLASQSLDQFPFPPELRLTFPGHPRRGFMSSTAAWDLFENLLKGYSFLFLGVIWPKAFWA